jgi:dTDP-4-dehydrorhamnose reductase
MTSDERRGAGVDRALAVLVVGASGMLGNTVLRFLAGSRGFRVVGTARSAGAVAKLPAEFRDNVKALNLDDELEPLFAEERPDVVVNCVGVVKQLHESRDPLTAIAINSLLPHRLARLCETSGARLIHVSTDCVFSGSKGSYTEDDVADARDLYGRSKLLGEVDYGNAITLRTSIIGHELREPHGLIEWFLSQRGPVRGYRRAVFSGLPTVELARVMRDLVIPRGELRGVFHVSAEPISKYDLLALVASTYGIECAITPSDEVVIDRSLDSAKFRRATGYVAPAWPQLIQAMRQFG